MHTRYQGFTIISSLILIVIVSILMSLGVWQLSRMVQKQDQLASIGETSSQATMTITEFVDGIGYKKFPSGTRVELEGAIDGSKIWLLDNQIFDKKVGYKALANLVTPKGNVLVDFGWIEAAQNRDTFPTVEIPTTLQGEIAVVTYPGKNAFVDGSFVETKQVEEVAVSRIQAIAEDNEFVLTLMSTSTGFERYWQPVVMPPEKHLGYAIQWFGLAIAASIIGFLRLKSRTKEEVKLDG